MHWASYLLVYSYKSHDETHNFDRKTHCFPCQHPTGTSPGAHPGELQQDLINNECANALADTGLKVRVVSEAPTEAGRIPVTKILADWLS